MYGNTPDLPLYNVHQSMFLPSIWSDMQFRGLTGVIVDSGWSGPRWMGQRPFLLILRTDTGFSKLRESPSPTAHTQN